MNHFHCYVGGHEAFREDYLGYRIKGLLHEGLYGWIIVCETSCISFSVFHGHSGAIKRRILDCRRRECFFEPDAVCPNCS